MTLTNKAIPCILGLFFLFLLSGCNQNEGSAENNYYLSLTAEGETWQVDGYEIFITPHKLKAGDGMLMLKTTPAFEVNYLGIEVHAIIGDEDRIIQTQQVTEREMDVAEVTTGAIEGELPLKGGEPITLQDVSDIYMIIEWENINKDEITRERIDLVSNAGTLFN